MVFLATALFVSASLALWLGARVFRAAGAGRTPFVCLSLAVAIWCAAGGGHALAQATATKLLFAKLQYLGIATVGPWWLLFTAEYAGVRRRTTTRARRRLPARLLWVIPTATILLAATNEWHHAVWTSVIPIGGRTVYSYGPWFWVAAAYNYALLAIGSFTIVRRALRSPSPLRQQVGAVVAAAIVPWAANVVFLARWVPLDLTPLAFAISSLLFAWALFRNALFDLVPVARDVVIDSLSDAMIVTDAARRVLDMNAAAIALARRHGTITDGRDAIGRPIERVFVMLREVPMQTAALMLTSPAAMPGGEPASVDVRVRPVGMSIDSPNAWVVLLRDVTEQRRAAAEREALERRVQEQDRRESVSILAAGVAHEFNNLLTGIVGNADLLALQVPASSTMETNVGEILLSAQRAAALVAKMLAYAGEGHAAIARVDLDALARDTAEVLRATTGERCTIVHTGAPTSIDADPAQIRQVAANLIVNAVEAVGDGGTVRVTTGTRILTTPDLARMRFGQDAPAGEYAFLEVRDDGGGMDETTMRRLFKPFFTTKPIGHGLGLAAVQGIVLGHRGALEVESRLGEGSRFRAWFPVARAADGSATAAIMRFDRTIRPDRTRRDGAEPGDSRLKESA